MHQLSQNTRCHHMYNSTMGQHLSSVVCNMFLLAMPRSEVLTAYQLHYLQYHHPSHSGNQRNIHIISSLTSKTSITTMDTISKTLTQPQRLRLQAPTTAPITIATRAPRKVHPTARICILNRTKAHNLRDPKDQQWQLLRHFLRYHSQTDTL